MKHLTHQRYSKPLQLYRGGVLSAKTNNDPLFTSK